MAFEISSAEAKTHIRPAVLDFMYGSTYDGLSQQAANLIEQGHPPASAYVPAVTMIVKTALETVTDPAIVSRIPSEVYERRDAALYGAEYATRLALRLGAFVRFYKNNPHIEQQAAWKKRDTTNPLRNNAYLLSLGQTPFFDTALVSGGALRLLRREQVTENPADVIARSTELLAISGIRKVHSDTAVDFLGLPYADTDHLALRDGEKGLEVTFAPDAKAFLANLRAEGHGCPAGKLETDETGHTLLEQQWGQMVHYLIPPNAIATRPVFRLMQNES